MHAKINGIDLFFDIVGSGHDLTPEGLVAKPVLVLHHGGPGCDHTTLRPFHDALADVAQLIYVDHRGTGRSGHAPVATYSVEQMADDIDALRAHLGIERISVLGHSFGGMVAQTYALRHPASLDKLLLVNTAPSSEFKEEAYAMAERMATPEQKEVVELVFEGEINTTEELEDWLETCDPLYYKHPERAAADLSGNAMIVGVEVLKHMMRHVLPQFDCRPFLPGVTAPTLVIGAEDDWVTPLSQARQMADLIPGARLEVFTDSGHNPFIEEHETYVALVSEFLAR